MTLRAAFVTIGQSPRPDVTPALLARIGPGIDVVEHGALDGLDAAGVAAMAPGPGEPRLVTRLKDGTEAVIGKVKTQERLQALFDRLDGEGYDALVLLCTGYFPGLGAKTLLVEAQRVVDHMTHALAEGAGKLGIMVPHEAQIAEFHDVAPPGVTVTGAHASPYSGDRFADAGGELAGCDLIVMHCMGYGDAQRDAVRAASGRPVLLAQRMLAAGVAQLV
jgi:protein AroM